MTTREKNKVQAAIEEESGKFVRLAHEIHEHPQPRTYPYRKEKCRPCTTK